MSRYLLPMIAFVVLAFFVGIAFTLDPQHAAPAPPRDKTPAAAPQPEVSASAAAVPASR